MIGLPELLGDPVPLRIGRVASPPPPRRAPSQRKEDRRHPERRVRRRVKQASAGRRDPAMLLPVTGPEITSATSNRGENLACSSLRMMRAGGQTWTWPSLLHRACHAIFGYPENALTQPGNPGPVTDGPQDGPWRNWVLGVTTETCLGCLPDEGSGPKKATATAKMANASYSDLSFHCKLPCAGGIPPACRRDTASQRRLVPSHSPFVTSPCTTTRARSHSPPPISRTMISYE